MQLSELSLHAPEHIKCVDKICTGMLNSKEHNPSRRVGSYEHYMKDTGNELATESTPTPPAQSVTIDKRLTIRIPKQLQYRPPLLRP